MLSTKVTMNKKTGIYIGSAIAAVIVFIMLFNYLVPYSRNKIIVVAGKYGSDQKSIMLIDTKTRMVRDTGCKLNIGYGGLAAISQDNSRIVYGKNEDGYKNQELYVKNLKTGFEEKMDVRLNNLRVEDVSWIDNEKILIKTYDDYENVYILNTRLKSVDKINLIKRKETVTGDSKITAADITAIGAEVADINTDIAGTDKEIGGDAKIIDKKNSVYGIMYAVYSEELKKILFCTCENYERTLWTRPNGNFNCKIYECDADGKNRKLICSFKDNAVGLFSVDEQVQKLQPGKDGRSIIAETLKINNKPDDVYKAEYILYKADLSTNKLQLLYTQDSASKTQVEQKFNSSDMYVYDRQHVVYGCNGKLYILDISDKRVKEIGIKNLKGKYTYIGLMQSKK